MIGRLRGTIAAVGEGQALIDVAGVGYLVHAGSRTLQKLTIGEPAELFVETQMSESAIRLFAFVAGEERAWFARLQDAPGVGAKTALAILDTLTLPQLMDAIALADTTAISRANGVGKKLAERIVTEFKGKPSPNGPVCIGPYGCIDDADAHRHRRPRRRHLRAGQSRLQFRGCLPRRGAGRARRRRRCEGSGAHSRCTESACAGQLGRACNLGGGVKQQTHEAADHCAVEPDILQVASDIRFQFLDNGLGIPASDRLRNEPRNVLAMPVGQLDQQ